VILADTCSHALLRRVTPGGRCPVCEPRANSDLAKIELEITPTREIIADANQVLREIYPDGDYPSDIELKLEIVRLKAQIELEEEALAAEDAALMLGSFPAFMRGMWTATNPAGAPLRPNAGTDAMALHFQALEDGEISLLAIASCPGLAKTTIGSVLYPAWIWARDPGRGMICASHAFELASDIAGRFRRLLDSDLYRRAFPHVRVTSEALKKIETLGGGKRYAVGVEGSLTGYRGHLGVIDDSINAVRANSRDAIRDANKWYEEAFSTRFDAREIKRKIPGSDPAAPEYAVERLDPTIAVIQQRLAQDDLIELVRRLGGEVLELPARFEVARRSVTCLWADPRSTEGELIAPDVQSESYLAERERALGARGFAGQYQQRPTPAGGNTFRAEHWGWCSLGAPETKERPEGCRGVSPRVLLRRPDGSLEVDWATLSVDATNGATGPDASALGIGLFVGSGLRRSLLRDFTDGPASWNQTLARVRDAIQASLHLTGKQRRFTVLLEKKAMGASDEAPLPTQVREMIAAGKFTWPDGSRAIVKLELYEPTGKGGKPERAAAMEPEVEAGLVELLDGAPWVPEFVGELGQFGAGGARDDRVDFTSQVLDYHRDKKTEKKSTLSALKKWGRGRRR
jgi:phage terminase large subunit-like protein